MRGKTEKTEESEAFYVCKGYKYAMKLSSDKNLRFFREPKNF